MGIGFVVRDGGMLFDCIKDSLCRCLVEFRYFFLVCFGGWLGFRRLGFFGSFFLVVLSYNIEDRSVKVVFR